VAPAAPEAAALRVSLAVRVVLAVWPLIAEAAVEPVAPVAQAALRVLAVVAAEAQRLACHVMDQAHRLGHPAIAAVLAVLVALVALVATPAQPDQSPTQQSPRSTGLKSGGLKSGGRVLRAPKNAIGLQGEHIALTLQPNALLLA